MIGLNIQNPYPFTLVVTIQKIIFRVIICDAPASCEAATADASIGFHIQTYLNLFLLRVFLLLHNYVWHVFVSSIKHSTVFDSKEKELEGNRQCWFNDSINAIFISNGLILNFYNNFCDKKDYFLVLSKGPNIFYFIRRFLL